MQHAEIRDQLYGRSGFGGTLRKLLRRSRIGNAVFGTVQQQAWQADLRSVGQYPYATVDQPSSQQQRYPSMHQAINFVGGLLGIQMRQQFLAYWRLQPKMGRDEIQQARDFYE